MKENESTQGIRLAGDAEQANRLLLTLIETMQVGVTVCNSDGETILFNSAARAIFGGVVPGSNAPVEGRYGAFHCDGTPVPTSELPLVRALKGERVTGVELLVRRPDGAERLVLAGATPVLDDAGRPNGAILTVMDITQSRRAEDEVRKLSRAVEQSPSTVVITDTAGSIEYANPKFAQLTGYTLEEALGHNPRVLKSGQTPPEVYEELWSTITSGNVWRGEFLNRKKNGDLYWESASISPIIDASGAITHYVAVKEDITDRKRAEEEMERLLGEIRHRAAELDTIITSIADGVIIYDLEGRAVSMNQAAERMLGYSFEEYALPPEERIQMLRMETSEGNLLSIDEAPAMRALDGETLRGFVMVIHPRDGRTLWVSTSAAPIRTDSKVIGSVVTLTDITELHALQEQREDYLRAVSHDLRGPLTSVQGHAQMLLRLMDRAGMEDSGRRSAEAVVAGARRMNAMVQELTDVVRIESGQVRLQPQPVDMPAFVRGLKDGLAKPGESDRILVVAPDPLTPALADPDRLDRILTNLISNALKYSDPGSPVEVHLEERDGQLVVEVVDRGQGIAPEEIDHLFNRYYRTSSARSLREGLGLGLYVTRGLVEAHGGRIWVESQMGHGSTFAFTLPVAAG